MHDSAEVNESQQDFDQSKMGKVSLLEKEVDIILEKGEKQLEIEYEESEESGKSD